MRKYARYLLTAGFLALAMMLLYLSAIAWGSLALGKVMFRLESPVSISEGLEVMRQREEALENEGEQEEGLPPALCLWGQKTEVMLENKNLSKAAQATAILLCGEPGLVFDGCQVPVQGDRDGCVISEGTAWELFGSIQVEGMEVSYGEAAYVIRQVLPIQGNIIAFQAAKPVENGEGGQQKNGQAQAAGQQPMEETLDRVMVKKQGGVSSRDLILELGMRYNLSVQMLDIELLRGVSGCCMLLAPFTVCAFVCQSFYRQCKKQKTMPGKIVMAGVSLLLMALSVFLLKNQIQVPEDYIPSRWSEFSFWTGLWEEKAGAVKFLVGMDKAELDYGWVNPFFKAAGCGLLAEMFLAAGIVSGWASWTHRWGQGKVSGIASWTHRRGSGKSSGMAAWMHQQDKKDKFKGSF